jgi:hypothetical protein
MSTIATGWVSIHPLQRTWRLHLSTKKTPRALLTKKKIRIQFGTWKKTLLITHTQPSRQNISAKVCIRSQKNQLSIGPFIGILTVAGNGLFRGVQSNFIDIIKAGQQIGALVYVMPVENIDWASRTVQGYLFNVYEKRWIKERLPLPHVIYNRIPNRVFEKQKHVKAALKRLSSMPNLTLYNPHFFNKQQLYAVLQRDPDVFPYLPHTLPLTSKDVFYNMTDSYPFVYVKPVNGMAGQGIYRLQHLASGYVLKYRERQKNITKKFRTRKEVWAFLAPRIKTAYLIQQGINLATFDNKLFDIRLLAQKDGHGQWAVTGMGVRLAASGNITTHVPRGGSIQSPKTILSAVFPYYAAEDLLASVHHIALLIAHSLEKEWATLGEVSMDIGIDKEARIWFIEANAKPGKFDEPHIRKLSLRRIVEYAQHQAQFVLETGEM